MKSSLKNMVLVLFCITLISSACVGLVNMITVEPIAKAKEALARTQQGVAEIARQLGFPSSQYFATQFKRETGLTPRAWRRQNQQGEGQAKPT